MLRNLNFCVSTARTVSASSQDVALSRRSLIGVGLAKVVSKSLAGVGASLGPLLTALPARADPVTIGLTIGTAVAGMIAANNRSDGGMGAILQANLAYQRVLTQQLAAVQDAMAVLMVRVSELPEAFQRELKRERLNQLQGKLGALLIQYQTEISRGAQFPGGFSSWIKDSTTQQSFVYLMNEMDNAVATATHERWADPISCLYLCAAVHASLGVRKVLGDPEPALMAKAQSFLNVFDIAEDPGVSGSCAESLNRNGSVLVEATKKLSPWLVLPDGESNLTADGWLGGVSIQDYTPRIPKEMDCVIEPGVVQNNPELAPIIPSLVDYRIARLRRSCYTISPAVDARFGVKEKFDFRARAKIYYIESTLKNTPNVQILQVALDTLRTEVATPTPPQIPDQVIQAIPVLNVDARTSPARLDAASKSPSFAAAAQRYNDMATAVESRNIAGANIALAAASLAAIADTRRSLFRTFNVAVLQ